MTLTGLTAIVTALIGSAAAEDVKETCYTIPASATARVHEETPDMPYPDGPLYVGSSAGGFDRSYISFSTPDIMRIPKKATVDLVITPTSGTCLSSYNNNICGLPMTIEAYTAGESIVSIPYVHEDVWDPKTMTWDNQPGYNEFGKLDSVRVAVTKTRGLRVYELDETEPLYSLITPILTLGTTGAGEGYLTGKEVREVSAQQHITLSVDDYVQRVKESNGFNTGLMLKVNNDTEEFRDFSRIVYEGELHLGRESQSDFTFLKPYLRVCK